MKKIVVIIAALVLFILVSCGDEEPADDAGELPDWDYANVVTDDENSGGNSDTGSELPGDSGADTGTNPGDTGDSGSSDVVVTPDDDPVVPAEECGNEKVDYNERCDTFAPMPCSDLHTMMSGVAYCNANCTAYNLTGCSKSIWGVVNIGFKTDFIMDDSKIGDPSYFAKGSVGYAAFNGLYGDTKTYFPGDMPSVSYASTTNYTGTLGGQKRQLTIKQYPIQNGVQGYPRHELEFAPGTFKVGGDYSINAVSLFDMVDNLLKLVRYRLIDKQNGVECIMGIGYSGRVNIKSVYPENEQLYEGGTISVVANDVDFYHPYEIPGYNDEENPQEVPAEVLKYPVCTK